MFGATGTMTPPVKKHTETQFKKRLKTSKFRTTEKYSTRKINNFKAGKAMNTLFLLMAQYDGKAVIPIDVVCRDYLNITVEKFKLKRFRGEIDIPIMRLGTQSQKAALGIHLNDLAEYIDRQRELATTEQKKLMNRQ